MLAPVPRRIANKITFHICDGVIEKSNNVCELNSTLSAIFAHHILFLLHF